MPRLRSGGPDNRISLLRVRAVERGRSDERRRVTEIRRVPRRQAEAIVLAQQDRVSCSADHVVIEHAGVAHGLILLRGRDVGGWPDTRGCREISR